ncbi:MAG: Holliday junction resolvase Hjc [Acidilobus sp.]
MRNPKAKGARAENELANMLWDEGFAVVRGPSSGGGSKRRFQPDLVAIKDKVVVAIEVKARSDEGPIYIDAEQVVGLSEFAKRAGGRAFIAFRASGGDWRFHPIENLKPTGASFKLPDPSSGLRFRDFLEIVLRRHKDLGEYLAGQRG